MSDPPMFFAASGPPVILNLVLWTQSETGTFKTNGGAAATASNDPVGQWLDQSGLTHDMLQATSGSRPTLQLNQVNGFPSVRFDGSDDSLKALFTQGNVSFTLFMVVRQITWGSGKHLAGAGSGDNFSFTQHSSSPNLAVVWMGAASTGHDNGNLAVGSWGIVCMNAIANNNQFIRVNAGTLVTQNCGQANSLGGLTIADHPGGGLSCNIELAEVLLYNSTLNTSDETLVRNYLNAKYLIF